MIKEHFLWPLYYLSYYRKYVSISVIVMGCHYLVHRCFVPGCSSCAASCCCAYKLVFICIKVGVIKCYRYSVMLQLCQNVNCPAGLTGKGGVVDGWKTLADLSNLMIPKCLYYLLLMILMDLFHV
jgi:hypothetical protein